MKTVSRLLAAALLSTAAMFAAPTIESAHAEKLVVTDVLVGQNVFSITIPTIEVVDGNMGEADIRELFKGGDLKSIAEKISAWSAASITIPEMRVNQKVKDADGKDVTVDLVYRNFSITNLKNGLAASSKIEGGDLTTTGAEPVKGTFGAFSTGRFDFAALLGFYVGGGDGKGELKTVYENVGFEGLSISGPNGFKCDFGKFAAAEFKARPMRMSLAEFMTMAEGMGAEPNPTQMQSLVGFYSDILTGIESSPSTFDGLTCKFADASGKPVDFSVGKIEMGGFGKGRYPGIAINNLDITVQGDGFVKAAKIDFKGMDFSGPLKAVEAAGSQLSPQWFETNYRKIMPAFDGFAFAGLDIDVPDESNPGERVKAKVGDFDLTLQNHQLGIPADVSVVANNVQADLPANTTDANILRMREMGYTSIDIGFALKAKWDEAAGTIVVDEVSTSGTDMGTFSITALLGNATKDLFAEDPGTQQGAAMGLSIKELSVSAENGGLVDKLIEISAKEQGQDAAAFRTQISGMAGGMIPMVLGGTAQATEVAEAVTAFLNGGKSITVSAEANDPAGLGMMDFMAAQENPASLAEKVTLSAEHE